MNKFIGAVAVLFGICTVCGAGSSNGYAANAMSNDSYSFSIESDRYAPEPITGLSVSAAQQTTVTISWNAPVDQGNTGIAASYDIRYALSQITAQNWANALPVDGEPIPAAGGITQLMNISGLQGETTYYFAMRSVDADGNISALSNVAVHTTPDQTAPSAISDVWTSQLTHSQVLLNWTAPGDDTAQGTATGYEIHYSSEPITAANWAAAVSWNAVPLPDAAGTPQTCLISGLTPATTYYFAIKTKDNYDNYSALSNVVTVVMNRQPDQTPPYTAGHSPSRGAIDVEPGTLISLHVKDDESGVDINTIVMRVNDIVVTPVITGTPSDYVLAYDPSADFQYGSVVTVSVVAADLAQ